MEPVFWGQCGVCLRVVRALPARSLVGGRGDPPGVCYLDPRRSRRTRFTRFTSVTGAPASVAAGIAAFNLAESIRRFGHLAARLDPLGFHDPIGDPSLAPQSHGLTSETLKQLPASIVSGPAAAGAANAFDAIATLRQIYCSTTGHDYNHVFVPDERVWLRQAVESGQFRPPNDPIDGTRAARSHHAGRDVRAIPASHLPGQDALFDRGPRHDGPDPRRDHPRRRRGRRAARDDRDGASRPAERARAHPAEAVLADPRGVQGSDPRQSAACRSRLDGRREVSRRRPHRSAARRLAEAGHHLDAAQPEPSRSGRPGAERHGARRGDDAPTGRARRSSTRARSWRF